MYHKYNHLSEDVQLSTLPSEIFRRQMFVTYEEEAVAAPLIPFIGAQSVMWASDYPHGASTWPNSRKIIQNSPIQNLDEESQQMILSGNAAKLYKIN